MLSMLGIIVVYGFLMGEKIEKACWESDKGKLLVLGIPVLPAFLWIMLTHLP